VKRNARKRLAHAVARQTAEQIADMRADATADTRRAIAQYGTSVGMQQQSVFARRRIKRAMTTQRRPIRDDSERWRIVEYGNHRVATLRATISEGNELRLADSGWSPLGDGKWAIVTER